MPIDNDVELYGTVAADVRTAMCPQHVTDERP
jgi:hypothetical protein